MGVERFQDLTVWKLAHEAMLATYKLASQFPFDERFVLVSQMHKASLSIPANIAEGFGRRSRADKSRFYNISQGSLEELRYYLIASRDLGYVKDTSTLDALLDRTAEKLKNLIRVNDNP
jgi:four helix bundle protein